MRPPLALAGAPATALADADDDLAECVDAIAQRLGKHLAQLRRRRERRLAECRVGVDGELAQRDGDGDRLVVVEQQRRQATTGTELVAAVATGRAGDRVAEVAQPGDVRGAASAS